jgi:hypothetical protein
MDGTAGNENYRSEQTAKWSDLETIHCSCMYSISPHNINSIMCMMANALEIDGKLKM